MCYPHCRPPVDGTERRRLHVLFVIYYYLRRRLASEGIVTVGVTLSHCMYLCVSAAKVMRGIQCFLVVGYLHTLLISPGRVLQLAYYTTLKILYIFY